MKLIHLSDLHLGKRVNEFSMLEDQKYILTRCINIMDEERPDAVILAGDIYDKSVPSAEAVMLFDDFLVRLAKRGLQVFVISGNHDSPERIAFASRLLDAGGVHLSPVYSGKIEPIPLRDAFVSLYMTMEAAMHTRSSMNFHAKSHPRAPLRALFAMISGTPASRVPAGHMYSQKKGSPVPSPLL